MKRISLMIPVLVLPLAACDQPFGQPGYASAPVQQVQTVQTGTITKMTNIEVGGGQNDQIGGALVGGLVGGIIGNQFGSGAGKDFMTGAGAIGGAVAGSRLAQNQRQVAQQWTVRLKNGEYIDVVQNDPNLYVGMRVRVIQNANGARLQP